MELLAGVAIRPLASISLITLPPPIQGLGLGQRAGLVFDAVDGLEDGGHGVKAVADGLEARPFPRAPAGKKSGLT